MPGLFDLAPNGSMGFFGAGAGRGFINPAIQAGNVDLLNRPVVKNNDGSISTVRSISVNFGGPEVLIPTVSPDGRLLSDKDAIALYLQSGQHLGFFNNPQSATEYAQSLHGDQARLYGPRTDRKTGSAP